MEFLAGLFLGIVLMNALGTKDIKDVVTEIPPTKTQNRIKYKGLIYYRNK